eukprot:CAMPEP_0180288240 /NCGR_PEP_ID=MMETSP0988-20121125/13927_1 /TAXON_ID=697907 /ORGANISM="non described non described, Strain CCMP2293" /LENGTH=92 /DNA_ID=CAMNT_0022262873 /DNA_START=18 /DNA_END=296 /DNA_ORIENTATION=+
MFATIRTFVTLLEEGGGDGPKASGGNADGHYLWFRGVPNPPVEYQAPTGSSPNTWPAIYGNIQNMDYCSSSFSHLGNRIKCMKSFTPSPLLP